MRAWVSRPLASAFLIAVVIALRLAEFEGPSSKSQPAEDRQHTRLRHAIARREVGHVERIGHDDAIVAQIVPQDTVR